MPWGDSIASGPLPPCLRILFAFVSHFMRGLRDLEQVRSVSISVESEAATGEEICGDGTFF
jgi:hypothetical protein